MPNRCIDGVECYVERAFTFSRFAQATRYLAYSSTAVGFDFDGEVETINLDGRWDVVNAFTDHEESEAAKAIAKEIKLGQIRYCRATSTFCRSKAWASTSSVVYDGQAEGYQTDNMGSMSYHEKALLEQELNQTRAELAQANLRVSQVCNQLGCVPDEVGKAIADLTASSKQAFAIHAKELRNVTDTCTKVASQVELAWDALQEAFARPEGSAQTETVAFAQLLRALSEDAGTPSLEDGAGSGCGGAIEIVEMMGTGLIARLQKLAVYAKGRRNL